MPSPSTRAGDQRGTGGSADRPGAPRGGHPARLAVAGCGLHPRWRVSLPRVDPPPAGSPCSSGALAGARSRRSLLLLGGTQAVSVPHSSSASRWHRRDRPLRGESGDRPSLAGHGCALARPRTDGRAHRRARAGRRRPRRRRRRRCPARRTRSPLTVTSSTPATTSTRRTAPPATASTGNGGGPLAGTTQVHPPSLLAHLSQHSDGDLFYWISNGMPGGMPAWAAKLTESDRWNLINYLRSINGVGPTPDVATPASSTPRSPRRRQPSSSPSAWISILGWLAIGFRRRRRSGSDPREP